MATKNSTLPVTTLLTVLKREIELQKTFCFKQDGKSQATRPSKSGRDYFLANHGLLNKKFSQSRNPIFGGTVAGCCRRSLKAILQFVTLCHRR